jgi:hypothetical protein
MRDESCSLYEEMRNAYKILVGIPEERRFLGRWRCRWEVKYCTVLRWIL